jgi:hemerythrin superfamily protein
LDAIELLQHDHRMVEQLFRDYRSAASANQRKGVVDILVRELSKHAAVEEELFYPPKVRDHLDEQALRELGKEIETAKRRAPTRPHPAAPDRPPALTLAAPVAAIYDRLRDRIQRRPRT